MTLKRLEPSLIVLIPPSRSNHALRRLLLLLLQSIPDQARLLERLHGDHYRHLRNCCFLGRVWPSGIDRSQDRVRSVPFTYVITGAVYQWPAKTIGKNKVPVPVALYKIAYFASGNKAIYFVDNIDKATVRTIGETDLEAKVGFDLP